MPAHVAMRWQSGTRIRGQASDKPRGTKPRGVGRVLQCAWFRYMQDVGPLGQDEGEGGKYLLLPPDYEGAVPDDYFVVRSPTYRVWAFMRGSIANGVEAAVKNVKDNLR